MLAPYDGIALTTVSNGAEAVALIGKARADLIFMDVNMPVMDGHTATRHIRSPDSPWRDVPVIMLTADSTQEQQALARASGATDSLYKPIDRQKFQALIQHYLGIVPLPG